jgi:ribosome-associated toxin RatA of RatAB toxin-antitoxin module
MNLFWIWFIIATNALVVFGGSKSKPHAHQGVLQSFDGKHIAYSISIEDNDKLESGLPVTINERNGKDGRGTVIQDVHASPDVCMDRIRDLKNYPAVVPNVRKVNIYDTVKHPNGTVLTSAEFNVGLSLLTFTYYLRLTYEPKYFTLTWTMDYEYNSDFDDTTGHWQVMQHPTKAGWSRVLYSTEVRLFPWIPEFVITFLTKTALIESTTWVKKESEKITKSGKIATGLDPYTLGDLSSCFAKENGFAKYITSCSENSQSAIDQSVPEEEVVSNEESQPTNNEL